MPARHALLPRRPPPCDDLRHHTDALIQTWLDTQCQLLTGVRRALVLRTPEGEPPRAGDPTPGKPERASARWPLAACRRDDLAALGRCAVDERQAVVRRYGQGADDAGELIALPLRRHPERAAAVVLDLAAVDDAARQRRAEQLSQGVQWLEFLLGDPGTRAEAGGERWRRQLGACLERGRLQAAIDGLATDLASDFSCERVSIGLHEGRRVRVRALSFSARFQPGSELLASIADAMEEAIEQDASVFVPWTHDPTGSPGGSHELALANGHLAREGAVLTLPICFEGEWYGAACLQWSGPQGPTGGQRQAIEELFALAGPLLGLLAAREQTLWQRAVRRARTAAPVLLGAHHPGARLLFLLLGAALTFCSLYPVAYRVPGDAVLEGRLQRVVVAPVDGFIAAAGARSGDRVRAGELLGALDDRELKLERGRWFSERQQAAREHRDALARRDRVEAGILETRIAQAEARIALLDSQLARLRVVAPFDGMVTEGDLSQSLGAPVDRGEALFTLAPLDRYRLVIKVDERDIAAIAPGQRGQLLLTSRHGAALPFTVEHITTLSTPEEGHNYFRVEATLDGEPEGLLPGLQGIARIAAGERSLLWTWTHRLTEWLALQWWYLRP